MVHTTNASLPAAAPIPPIEIITSAGTPLAIQKAPFQSIALWSPSPWSGAEDKAAALVSLIIVIDAPPTEQMPISA
jgi:hypothetical protein